MKVESDRQLKSSTEETLNISITWDPSDENADGYAALIATMCDLVRKINVLEAAIEDMEDT